jgi:hypothetical protein
MPSPICESIRTLFAKGFDAARSTLPVPLRTKITATTNEVFSGFGGQYRGSNKTPDLAVYFESADGNYTPKFILETAISQTYDSLVKDAIMWLEGRNDVSLFVLAKFQESPRYQCPVYYSHGENFERLGFPRGKELTSSDFILEDEHGPPAYEYGPATYKGFMWVGQISVAFMEIWRRDPMSGLATRIGGRIVGNDQEIRCSMLTSTSQGLHGTANPPQIEFQLSDFLDIAPENDHTIRFEWDDHQLLIRDAIKKLAMFRCQDMLRDHMWMERSRLHPF